MKVKPKVLASALIVLCCCGADTAQRPELKPFTSAAGRFTVALPGVPKEEKVPVDDPNDKTASQVQYALGTPHGAFLISFQDNPKLVEARPEAAAAALLKVQRGLEKSLSGKLLSQKEIKLADKYTGRAFDLSVQNGSGLYRTRIYLVKGRLYQVIAVGEKDFSASATADSVFDSFKLVP